MGSWIIVDDEQPGLRLCPWGDAPGGHIFNFIYNPVLEVQKLGIHFQNDHFAQENGNFRERL